MDKDEGKAPDEAASPADPRGGTAVPLKESSGEPAVPPKHDHKAAVPSKHDYKAAIPPKHDHKAAVLFGVFFRVSLLTLGGGYAMVPIAQRRLADRGIMGDDEFYACLALAQSLPGPIIFNTAFLAGSRASGPGGAFLAALGVVLPPFAVVLGLGLAFEQVAATPWARGFVKACFGTVLGFVASLVVKIARAVRWRPVEALLVAGGTAAAFLLPAWAPAVVPAIAAAAYLGRRG